MYRNFFKRFLDLILTFAAFLVAFPVFLGIIILLWFANKGKPFFFQKRPGKNEKIFRVVKFKTMNDKRDPDGNLLSDAKRLTKVGRFVRSTSLDELPQLWNVLKGDMSLIGPRPLLVVYLDYYTEKEKERHLVRPGITGLAQISGRNNLSWNERLKLDVIYVENISFMLDFKIVCKTVKIVLLRKDIAVIPGLIFQPLNIERSNENNLPANTRK